MDIKQFGNIAALKITPDSWVGFHAHNLQLAELHSDVFQNLDELKEWSNEIDPETNWAEETHFLNNLSVNVAQVCNLACTYCAAGGDGTYGSAVKRLNTEKFLPQLQSFLEQLPDGETFNIHLLGGEPLLFPNVIREIADFTKNHLSSSGRNNAVSYSITTNGTLINARNAQLLADLKAGVTVSIDGTKEINDIVRPNKGSESSTDLTLKGLKNLAAVREQLSSLSVNCVFGAHNLAIVEAYEFLNGLGVDWDIYNFNFSNADKSLDVTTAYISKMAEVAERAMNIGGLAELAKIVQFRGPMSRIESKTRLKSYCGAGKSLLQVDTSQDVYPCNWFMGDESEKLGHGLQIDSAKRAQFSESLIELNNCNSCWARHLCAGGCMAVHKAATGSKHQKDPQFCLRSRSLSALAIKCYYEALSSGVSEQLTEPITGRWV